MTINRDIIVASTLNPVTYYVNITKGTFVIGVTLALYLLCINKN